MTTGDDRYSLQSHEVGSDLHHVALWDNHADEPVSVIVAKNRLNRGQRVIDAGKAVLAKLDYLQSLWGKEGVTNTLAEQLRLALADAPDGEQA